MPLRLLSVLVTLLMSYARHKIIIVADPGVDDAGAIMLAALSHEVELLAVVSQYGVCAAECTLNNTLAIMERLNKEQVPVALGARYPLGAMPQSGRVKDSLALLYHGPRGLGHFTGTPTSLLPDSKTGAEVLLSSVRDFPGEVHVLNFSPCTTLAHVLSLDAQGFTAGVKGVHIMGGALNDPGNVSPLAESNFHQDPLSANLVVSSFSELGHARKVVISPLDVTLQAVFTEDQLHDQLRSGPGRWWATDVTPYYIRQYATVLADKQRAMPLHDAHPLAHLIHPEWYQGVRVHGVGVVVEAGPAVGMLYYDARAFVPLDKQCGDSQPNVDESNLPLILKHVDAAKFSEWVLVTLAGR